MANNASQNARAGPSNGYADATGFAGDEDSSPEPPPVKRKKRASGFGIPAAASPAHNAEQQGPTLHRFRQADIFTQTDKDLILYPTATEFYDSGAASIPTLSVLINEAEEVVLGCAHFDCPLRIRATSAYGGCLVDYEGCFFEHEHDVGEKQHKKWAKPGALKMDEGKREAPAASAEAEAENAPAGGSQGEKGKEQATEGEGQQVEKEEREGQWPAKDVTGPAGSPSGSDKGKGKEMAAPVAASRPQGNGEAGLSPGAAEQLIAREEEEDVKPNLKQLNDAERPAKRNAEEAESSAPKEKKAKTAASAEGQVVPQQPAVVAPAAPSPVQQPPPSPAARVSHAGVQPQAVASTSQHRLSSVKPSPAALRRFFTTSTTTSSSPLTPSASFLAHLTSLSPSPTFQFTSYSAALLTAGISSPQELHESAALLGEEAFLLTLADGAREAGVGFPAVGRRLLWRAVGENPLEVGEGGTEA